MYQTTPGFVLVKSMFLHRFSFHLPIELYTAKQFLSFEGFSYLVSGAFCFALYTYQRLVCKFPVYQYFILLSSKLQLLF